MVFSDLLANVQHIRFSDEQPNTPTSVENTQGNNALQVKVYPNPTQDVLYVKGTENTILRVYDMQGQLLQTAEGDRLTVSSLSTGTYLLQIGTQVVRFIKR